MKKLNKRGFSLIDGLVAVFVLVLVVGLGFYAKNRIDNKSSKAESGSAESYSTLWQNIADTRLQGCRHYNNGIWWAYIKGWESSSHTRKVVVWKDSTNSSLGTYTKWQGRTSIYRYGTATTGSIIFYVMNASSDVGNKIMKFKNLPVC